MPDLERLLDHPPRDPEGPPSPRFTAQVMEGVRRLPRPARGGQDRAWWWIAGLAGLLTCAIPGDWWPNLGTAGGDLLTSLLPWAVELAVACALLPFLFPRDARTPRPC